MRVRKIVDGKFVPVPGPGDLNDYVGDLLVTGKGAESGPWVVALGYAVLRGCSIARRERL